jgi:hypothetical protein
MRGEGVGLNPFFHLKIGTNPLIETYIFVYTIQDERRSPGICEYWSTASSILSRIVRIDAVLQLSVGNTPKK